MHGRVISAEDTIPRLVTNQQENEDPGIVEHLSSHNLQC